MSEQIEESIKNRQRKRNIKSCPIKQTMIERVLTDGGMNEQVGGF